MRGHAEAGGGVVEPLPVGLGRPDVAELAAFVQERPHGAPGWALGRDLEGESEPGAAGEEEGRGQRAHGQGEGGDGHEAPAPAGVALEERRQHGYGEQLGHEPAARHHRAPHRAAVGRQQHARQREEDGERLDVAEGDEGGGEERDVDPAGPQRRLWAAEHPGQRVDEVQDAQFPDDGGDLGGAEEVLGLLRRRAVAAQRHGQPPQGHHQVGLDGEVFEPVVDEGEGALSLEPAEGREEEPHVVVDGLEPPDAHEPGRDEQAGEEPQLAPRLARQRHLDPLGGVVLSGRGAHAFGVSSSEFRVRVAAGVYGS